MNHGLVVKLSSLSLADPQDLDIYLMCFVPSGHDQGPQAVKHCYEPPCETQGQTEDLQ